MHNAIDRLKTRVEGISYLIPLSAGSGGEVWSVLKKDVKGDKYLNLETNTLPEALKKCGQHDQIIFVDDNAASGIQSCAQLYSYCVADKSTWPEELRTEDSLFGVLTEEEILSFQETFVGIAVAIGNEAACCRLKETCQNLSIKKFQGLEYEEEIGEKIDIGSKLQAFLCNVGQELFARDCYKKDYANLTVEEQERCKKHALGYNNFRGMTILASNVPTSTLTSVWMPGIVNGRPWQPLAIRWGRLKNLRLS